MERNWRRAEKAIPILEHTAEENMDLSFIMWEDKDAKD